MIDITIREGDKQLSIDVNGGSVAFAYWHGEGQPEVFAIDNSDWEHIKTFVDDHIREYERSKIETAKSE